ncbi:hypothetical protein C8R46DRAFT_1024336 [Mycena filopes]|nr:hypothetical protein C8R46DRAFT_1024336 [Mycena filopes]
MLLTSGPHPLCVSSSFPRLQTLRLTEGPDAEIGALLAWLAAFLAPAPAPNNPSDRSTAADSPIERRCSATRDVDVDELALSFGTLSTATYTSYPALRTLTFTGYQRFSIGGGAPDAFEHFSKTVRERLPKLAGRRVVVVGRVFDRNLHLNLAWIAA